MTIHDQRRKYRTAWFLGLDLGQRRDHAALATLELSWSYQGQSAATREFLYQPSLIVRDLQRFQLGTGYRLYAGKLQSRARHIAGRDAAAPIYLTIDAGGPGQPVVEEIRSTLQGVDIQAAWINGAASPSCASDGSLNIPRRNLIANLLLLIEHGVCKAPRALPDWSAFIEELLGLAAATSQPASSSAHDDLVIACGLAAWKATRLHGSLVPKPPANPPRGYGRLL